MSAERWLWAAQVEWTVPTDPAKGFQYLYLMDADYQRLNADKIAVKVNHVCLSVIIICMNVMP